MVLIAATDGSALSNPGPAGWAWYLDDDTWAAGGWSQATNNQAELQAVLELLKATASCNQPLKILCDSRYVIDSLTKWRHGWKKKGWRKADGSPVLNMLLMQDLDSALADRDVEFEWVKGHAGHPLNERADSLAQQAATAFKLGKNGAAGPGFSTQKHAPLNETAADPHPVESLKKPAQPEKQESAQLTALRQEEQELLMQLGQVRAAIAELESSSPSNPNQLF